MATATATIQISVISQLPLLAKAVGTPISGDAPLSVLFSGSASGGSQPYGFSWEFGDGGVASSAVATHIYTDPGLYTAVLTVTGGSSVSIPQFISSGTGVSVAAGSALAPTWPLSPISGYLAILHAYVKADSGQKIIPPSGWTLITEGVNGIDYACAYRRVLSGTETGAVTLTAAGAAGRRAAQIHMFSGSGNLVTEGESAISAAASTTVNDNPVTTTGLNRLAINCIGYSARQTTQEVLAGETGGTWFAKTFFDGGANPSLSVQTADMTAAGTVGGGSDTSITSSGTIVLGFAIVNSLEIATDFINITVSSPSGQNEQNLFLNPFNHLSAHHRPMGNGATFAAANSTMAVEFTRLPFGSLNTPTTGSGAVVVKAVSTDPTRTVTLSGTKPFGTFPVSLKMPDMLTATGGGDRTAICFAVDGTCYEFYQFAWNNGAPTSSGYRTFDPAAACNPKDNNIRFGVSASGESLIMGLMRGFELNDNAFGPIKHVCQMTLNTSQVSSATVWPAAFIDGGLNPTGSIPYGQLFALPSSTNLTTLFPGSTDADVFYRRIGAMCRDYGVIIVDTTSAQQNNVRGDQDITTARINQFATAMSAIHPLLRPVTNSTATQTASGGGTALAPNGAYDV